MSTGLRYHFLVGIIDDLQSGPCPISRPILAPDQAPVASCGPCTPLGSQSWGLASCQSPKPPSSQAPTCPGFSPWQFPQHACTWPPESALQTQPPSYSRTQSPGPASTAPCRHPCARRMAVSGRTPSPRFGRTDPACKCRHEHAGPGGRS